MNRDRSIRTFSLSGRSPEHRPDRQIYQAERILLSRVRDLLFDLYRTRLERISVNMMS